MRGGGTSQAGQAIGAGLVVDTSKLLQPHSRRERRRALGASSNRAWSSTSSNAQLRPHGLRFAPDISTASRATIGGMIANNSCGASIGALRQDDRPRPRAGRRAERRHVRPSRRAIGAGARRAPAPAAASKPPAIGSCGNSGAPVATRSSGGYPKVMRRVGGYNLDEFDGSVEAVQPRARSSSAQRARSRLVTAAKLSLGSAAAGQGGPGDRVRRSARRSGRHTARSCDIGRRPSR